MPTRDRLTYFGALAALAVVYVVTARFGLRLDAVAGFATLVWPASGIALAALVLGGYRLWPAIFAGAVVTNLLTGAPVLVALGIGIGNTLEAVVGAYALRRIPGFRPTLDRVQDAVSFIGLAAILATAISATVGNASLYAGGLLPTTDVARAWRAWWVGDIIGDLVVAPVLLVVLSTPRAWPRARTVEALALLATIVAVSVVVFVAPGAQAYFIVPPLIWATLRFAQPGAVTATFITSVIAVWGTAAGHGPFARPVLNESLLALQTFMSVGASTFLLFGASIGERPRAAAELQRAHAAVSEANRVKGEFLAVMSHELRTPLNAIGGYVELLSMEVADPITDGQRDYLQRIQANARHLLAMIDDVLSFAKTEAGKLSLTLGPVGLAEVLQDVETASEPELRRRQLVLTCERCDPSIVIHGDPERLRQILLNLVGNAIKFTPAGGAIRIATEPDAETVRISVSDTGVGIPAEQLERVFEPFFQVDSGTTRAHAGIGLGLAIARDLARAMGGELRLTSEPGRGTTATLELRRAAAA